MATPNRLAALQTLMKLKSPSNVASLQSPKEMDIATGMDTFAPSDGQLEDQQIQDQKQMLHDTGGSYGFIDSRENGRNDIMQVIRQKLALGDIAHRQELESKILPEQVKGEYGVRQAEATGKAQADRLRYTQEAIGGRQDSNQAAIMGRLDKTLGAAQSRQDDQQAFKGGQVSPAALAAIARERQALVTAQGKAQPYALSRMFGKTNPVDAQVKSFDNALAAAQEIVAKYPHASAEEALATMGDSPSPDELGQVQKFLLLLRGH